MPKWRLQQNELSCRWATERTVTERTVCKNVQHFPHQPTRQIDSKMRRAASAIRQVIGGGTHSFSTAPLHKGTVYQDLPREWTVLGGAGSLGQVLVDFLIDAGASSIKVITYR